MVPCHAVVTLADRHMKVSTKCPACELSESVKHMLFQCQKTRQVWLGLGFEDAIEHACKVDHVGEAMLEYLLCLHADETRVLGQVRSDHLMAVAVWYLWWERTKLVHDEQTQQPTNNLCYPSCDIQLFSSL